METSCCLGHLGGSEPTQTHGVLRDPANRQWLACAPAPKRGDDGPLLDRAFELRAETFYDGLYLALAEAADASLLTRDARLGRVIGHRATVEVFR